MQGKMVGAKLNLLLLLLLLSNNVFGRREEKEDKIDHKDSKEGYWNDTENLNRMDFSFGRVMPDPEQLVQTRLGSSINSETLIDVFKRAMDIVERETSQFEKSVDIVPTGTSSSRHQSIQRPEAGIQEQGITALTGVIAARELTKGSDRPVRVGLRSTNLLGTPFASECERLNLTRITCDEKLEFRTFDGTCNNLKFPVYGKSGTALTRVLNNQYEDGLNVPRGGFTNRVLPSARLVSTAVTSVGERTSSTFSSLMMSFGQFVDHDLTFTPVFEVNGKPVNCCSVSTSHSDFECLPIRVPKDDPIFPSSCMNFVRSLSAPRLDCTPGPTEQVNQLTHWLDLSTVYGSSSLQAHNLRMLMQGLLAVSFAPLLKRALLPQNPREVECTGRELCFKAGDSRVNEQPVLASMHTLFLREHNRIAEKLLELRPKWEDEKLFQVARHITIAQYQHIVFSEWLPILLSPKVLHEFNLKPLKKGFSKDYFPTQFDPRITNEFATAAMRLGHSLIHSDIIRVDVRSKRVVDRKRLRDIFFNVDALYQPEVVGQILKGAALLFGRRVDWKFADDIRNFLFDNHEGMGMDLIALNIQRGRDHGISDYLSYVNKCRGTHYKSFNDLRKLFVPGLARRFRALYRRATHIDLYAGAVSERLAPGARIGPTFQCLIADQFRRIKAGDRFFYDLGGQTGSFTEKQLDAIRHATMARLICDNTDVELIQPRAFRMPSKKNRLTHCSDTNSIPVVDLKLFV